MAPFRKTIYVVLYLTVVSGANYSQPPDEFLGIRLRPEIKEIVKEIETKTGKKIRSEFIEQTDSLLASSYIDEDGSAMVLVDFSVRNNAKKLEAIIVHELLHLRLRVNNYPTFVFSPLVRMAKGRAIDTEQDNINDLKDLIEHRVFKADMERFGVYKSIDLAGDTAAAARKRKGQMDGQADAINYARAILEYQNQPDVSEVRRMFQANGWTRSLQLGQDLAEIISRAEPRTTKDVETIFLSCLLKMYPTRKGGITFKLTVDRNNRYFRRLIISTV